MTEKRMLIEHARIGDTRVAVLNGNKLETFDAETALRPIKGNIYLAQVHRIEPSLQAAFVEFNGEMRHGFLSFQDIHADYHRIPLADQKTSSLPDSLDIEDSLTLADAEFDDTLEQNNDTTTHAQTASENATVSDDSDDATVLSPSFISAETDDHEKDDDDTINAPEQLTPPEQTTSRYRIQEVIKRRQVMLVQAIKEERGGKGAALTTYISLPGRYCILMPNLARGVGVSRKISKEEDRKKLKQMVQNLNLPPEMSIIIRTAGLGRTKTEMKRDIDYLLRLWEDIRSKALQAQAPSLVYEEGDLLTKAIRDTYNREIHEVLVTGQAGYKKAKNLMRMLIPSHSKKVILYSDSTPLFHKFGVEQQLEEIYSPKVIMNSGASLVINMTEALVAIDVNSGRSIRQRNAKETAYHTNLEAAEEIARQIRLRDLAGIIVIDFIDMESAEQRHAVEKKLRSALKNDRARMQLTSINALGLLSLSRQRLRPSLFEMTSSLCTHCHGTGFVNSIDSTVTRLIRTAEIHMDQGQKNNPSQWNIVTSIDVMMHLLNYKRFELERLEKTYNASLIITHDASLLPAQFRITTASSAGNSETSSTTVSDEKSSSDVTDKTASNTEKKSTSSRNKRKRKNKKNIPDSAIELQKSDDSTDQNAHVISEISLKQQQPANDVIQPHFSRRRKRAPKTASSGDISNDLQNKDDMKEKHKKESPRKWWKKILG